MQSILAAVSTAKAKTDATRTKRIRSRHVSPMVDTMLAKIQRMYSPTTVHSYRKIAALLRYRIKQSTSPDRCGFEWVASVLDYAIDEWPRLLTGPFRKWRSVPDYPSLPFVMSGNVWDMLEQYYQRTKLGIHRGASTDTYEAIESQLDAARKREASIKSKLKHYDATIAQLKAALERERREGIRRAGELAKAKKSIKKPIAVSHDSVDTPPGSHLLDIGLRSAEELFREPVAASSTDFRTEKFYAWELLP